ncbi:MAG: hypothetical protein ACOVQM_09065 [Pirellula sp.]|jgi:hypothetical protein
MMDFAAALSSDSVREQADAAIFLRSKGADGAEHLAALLRCCAAVKTSERSTLDKLEEALLGYGAATMGDIVRQVGFDSANPLHGQILGWIVETTESSNLNVAGGAIWGVGLLGAGHPVAVSCLKRIIESDLRAEEHEIVKLRAIALRMLAMIDVTLATGYRSSKAWLELRNSYDWWQRESPVEWLKDELRWLF